MFEDNNLDTHKALLLLDVAANKTFREKVDFEVKQVEFQVLNMGSYTDSQKLLLDYTVLSAKKQVLIDLRDFLLKIRQIIQRDNQEK